MKDKLNELCTIYKIDSTGRQLIEELIKKEIFGFMYAIQDKANNTRPNLLLNEVVNYAYDRLKELNIDINNIK